MIAAKVRSSELKQRMGNSPEERQEKTMQIQRLVRCTGYTDPAPGIKAKFDFID